MAARQEVTFLITARDKTRAAFRSIGRAFRRMRLGIASIVASAGFGALTKSALSFAAALEGASERLKVPVQQLEALQQQSKAFGQSTEGVNTLLQRLGTRAGEAIAGSTRMIDNFAELGVTLQDLRNAQGNPAEIFLKVADGVREAAEAGEDLRAQFALSKIGDSEGVRFLALLRQGSDEIRAETARLIDEGTVKSEEATRALAGRQKALDESLERFNNAFQGILVKLLPFAATFAEWVKELLDDLPKILDKYVPPLKEAADRLTGALEAFGSILPNGDTFNRLAQGFRQDGSTTVGRLEAAILRQQLEEQRRTNQALEKLDLTSRTTR